MEPFDQIIDTIDTGEPNLGGNLPVDNGGIENFGFTVQIYSDNPEGPLGYSQPADLLWQREFSLAQLTILPQDPDLQGWLDPSTQEFIPENHDTWALVNITEIPDPFLQTEGEIYWLAITVGLEPLIPGGPVNPECPLGWKQSGSQQFNDDAVWMDPSGMWMELRDPLNRDNSLDLAFVITPEPTTMLLLGCGAVAILRRRHVRV